MQPFIYVRDADAAPQGAAYRFLAGGTTLIDLMKLDVERPETIVDIAKSRPELRSIRVDGEGARLGALATMAEVAAHPAIARDYPVVAQSLLLAASAQIRNMASVAGNLLQRTRCPYFRDISYGACNKRNPGSGCSALDGVNRQHAVLGTSEACIATYPGDFAQAMIALDGFIETGGPQGGRRIAVADLHRSSDTPEQETVLRPGELIESLGIPKGPYRRSLYLKIRDRESYEFALASAAVALDVADGRVSEARIALGGVAYKPWRARAAEDVLRGGTMTEETALRAAEAAFAEAKARKHNAFKIELGKQTLVRALLEAGKMEI